ncbi:hypothetical protein HPB50_013730 [Hyalomma asiaticum]|uniref:Uncharacterized protein n=1 Tax=Hyalomma asiaticum TaxID=266040 RepID=A0ACB7RXD7_HYAAI|nr:hypothetical protein HPB50_013730 [Hyalomma asiaticum]
MSHNSLLENTSPGHSPRTLPAIASALCLAPGFLHGLGRRCGVSSLVGTCGQWLNLETTHDASAIDGRQLLYTVSPGFLQLGAIGMSTYEASRAFKALWMRRLLAQGRREVARKNAAQEGNQPNQTLQSAPTLGREAMASTPSSGTVNATTVPALCPREDVYPALVTRSASSVRSGKQARHLLLLRRMRADFTASMSSERSRHCA